MNCQELRQAYPHQWLVVEAIESFRNLTSLIHSEATGKRRGSPISDYTALTNTGNIMWFTQTVKCSILAFSILSGALHLK